MARDEQGKPETDEIVSLNANELDVDQLDEVSGGLSWQPGLGPGESCEMFCGINDA